MQDLSWLSPIANGVNSSNRDSLTLVLGLVGIAFAIPIFFYTLQCAAKIMRWTVDLALKAAVALLVVALAMVAWQALASPWLKQAFQIDATSADATDHIGGFHSDGFPIYQGKAKESDNSDFISLALETKDGRPLHYKIPKWSHKVDGGGPWVRLVKSLSNFDTTKVVVGLVTDLAWNGVTSLASVPFGLASRLSDTILKATVGHPTPSDKTCASTVCAETLRDCQLGIRCMCSASEIHMSLTERLWMTFGVSDISESIMGTETRPCLSPTGDKIGRCQCENEDEPPFEVGKAPEPVVNT